MPIEDIQLEFPTSPLPAIPPWSELNRRVPADEPAASGIAQSPIPDRGFPVSRGFAQPFDYDFSSNTPTASSAGETFDHPFKINITSTDGNYKYTLTKGSVIDGTNGTAYDIGNPETERDPSAGFVTIKATIDTNLDVTGWAIGIEDETAAAEEVVLSGSPLAQTYARLVIGKITMAGSVPTAWQMWLSSARLTHGLVNGAAARVFEAAPTHPSKV